MVKFFYTKMHLLVLAFWGLWLIIASLTFLKEVRILGIFIGMAILVFSAYHYIVLSVER